MAGVDDDSSLAEDMSNVEVLLGYNVVPMVQDNLILDLLRAYSTDRNRVQRVVNELQQTYLKKDDPPLSMDEDDDDVLLALDSPYLPRPTLSSNDHTHIAQNGSVHTSASDADVSSSSSNASPESVGMREPILQPAKFNVAADQWSKTNTNKSQKTGTISSSSQDDSPAGSFTNHRNAGSSRTSDDSSSTSTDSDSEPEIVSIHEEDRKRRKLCDNKSPGKKTKVEVVDLVTSSPNSALDSNEYFGILQAMFPDADPVYLRQRFKHIDDEQELNAVAAAMLEGNNYPRIVAGGLNALPQTPSTSSSTHHSVPVIKPSVLQAEPGDGEGKPKNIGEKEAPFLNPDEVVAVISAIESAPISANLPKSCGTPSDVPAAVVQPHPSANQELAPTEDVVSMPLPQCPQVPPPSTTTAGIPPVPSTQTISSHPDQAGVLPQIRLQPGVKNQSANSSPPPEKCDIPPETLAPPPTIKEDVQPSVSNCLDLRGMNEPGPSGTANGYIEEEPWAEKYSLLLCILPESDPKFLEEKARQLHDKDEEFKLFVETSLDNPPPNDDRRGNGQVTPAEPAVRIANPVSSDVNVSGSKIMVAQKPGNANGLSAANMPGSSSTIISGTSVASRQAPGPIGANLPGPSGANLPGPSGANLPGPSGANLPGPSGANLPGPSGANLPGPSGTNLPGPSGTNLPGPSGMDPAVAGANGLDNSDSDANPWSEQHSFLLSILPEADPTFLEEKAKLLYDKDEEMKTFVANALENKDYPTLKDYQRRQELVALQNKYLKDFNIENFLDIVPEPFKYFSQSTRKPSAGDQNRGLLFLKRKYRLVRSNDINAVYKKNNYNLTNTCHELDQFKGQPLKSRRSDFQTGDKLSDTTLSLQLLQELAFIENEGKIKKYLKDKEDEEKQALKEAQEKGELLECNCCFDDEVLARNIVACPEGHIFCRSCVRKGAETKIGEGTTIVSCLTDCKAEFTLQSLQSVLKPTVFSKLAQRKQLEEIKAAGIEDLVQCPFCDFCNIPSAGDKVFRCLNPDCMKNSCIMCKEESHIPLRCNEVEKATEVKMRTYIEDKMTEALVRQCWKCQRKFVKIDGCNKMTCQCGALMCYICRQPVKDYSHFNGQGGEDFQKCPLFSDNNALHVDAVEKVAAEAKAELAQKHPGLSLRHDPTAVPIAREAGRTRPHVLARGYGNVGVNLQFPRPMPPPVVLAHIPVPAPHIRIPQIPVPQIPAPPIPAPFPAAQNREYFRLAADAVAVADRYRAQPVQPRHHNDYYRVIPHRPQRPRAGDAQMDLPELRDFAADVLADLQRDAALAYLADQHRPADPNNRVAPYNVNVAAPNGNAYYAQDMRQRRQYPHHPN